jgi:hypothetical protein
MLKKLAIIRGVSDFLRVEQDLVELAGLCEACDHLVGHVGAQIYTQGQREIMGPHDVTELFTAIELLDISR